MYILLIEKETTLKLHDPFISGSSKTIHSTDRMKMDTCVVLNEGNDLLNFFRFRGICSIFQYTCTCVTRRSDWILISMEPAQ